MRTSIHDPPLPELPPSPNKLTSVMNRSNLTKARTKARDVKTDVETEPGVYSPKSKYIIISISRKKVNITKYPSGQSFRFEGKDNK